MAQASSVEQAYTVGSWLKSAVFSKPTLWFMAQASSVKQDNTIGLLLTGSDGYDNTACLLVTGSDGYDNTVGLLLTDSNGPFAFYCFTIYFNLYFFVESGFALYTLRR